MILRANLRLGQRQHLQRVLRIGEALEPALTQGIECDDRYAALPDLIELMQHARTVDADILAEEEHAIGLVEVLDLHCAYRNANRFRQSNRSALVAHIRAVGQIVGPVHAREQLVHVGGFERGTPRGVEHHLFRIEASQGASDLCQGFIPRDWPVFVARSVVAHRLGQTSGLFEIVVRPAFELAQRVLGKEIWPAAIRGDFPRRRLRAVLAEFEGMGVAGLCVGAADTLIA
jgi:hypothetical protein